MLQTLFIIFLVISLYGLRTIILFNITIVLIESNLEIFDFTCRTRFGSAGQNWYTSAVVRSQLTLKIGAGSLCIDRFKFFSAPVRHERIKLFERVVILILSAYPHVYIIIVQNITVSTINYIFWIEFNYIIIKNKYFWKSVCQPLTGWLCNWTGSNSENRSEARNNVNPMNLRPYSSLTKSMRSAGGRLSIIESSRMKVCIWCTWVLVHR